MTPTMGERTPGASPGKPQMPGHLAPTPNTYNPGVERGVETFPPQFRIYRMPKSLGEFEQLILFAALRLGDEAYGASIRREIEECTGRPVTAGSVYTVLDRLETRGLVSSFTGEPTPQRGLLCGSFPGTSAVGRICSVGVSCAMQRWRQRRRVSAGRATAFRRCGPRSVPGCSPLPRRRPRTRGLHPAGRSGGSGGRRAAVG